MTCKFRICISSERNFATMWTIFWCTVKCLHQVKLHWPTQGWRLWPKWMKIQPFFGDHTRVCELKFHVCIGASARCSRAVTFYLRFECLFEHLPVWDCYKNERQQRAELSWEDQNIWEAMFGIFWSLDGKSNIVNKKGAALDPNQVDKLVLLENNARNLGPFAICQIYIYLATFLVKE